MKIIVGKGIWNQWNILTLNGRIFSAEQGKSMHIRWDKSGPDAWEKNRFYMTWTALSIE